MDSYISSMDSPIGRIEMAALDEGLIYCASARENGQEMISWLKKYLPSHNLIEGDNHILREAKTQLKDYFEGKNKDLDIPILLIGTDFRKTVWEALRTIPYGETKTYGQIASQIGKPKASRAVGQANHHNPISYFVP